MVHLTSANDGLPPTVAGLVKVLLSEFPPQIRWTFPGAYLHLIAEVYELFPRLVEHAEQKLTEPFVTNLARLSAVMLEDIEHADPDDPTPEVVSALEGITNVVRIAGMKRRPDAPEDWSLSASFYECAKNWDLDGVAQLLQSRWHWPGEPSTHSTPSDGIRHTYQEPDGVSSNEERSHTWILRAFVIIGLLAALIVLFDFLQKQSGP